LSKIIDHDPTERPGRRYSLGKWWLGVWAFIGLIWVLQALTDGYDWGQITLGVITGVMFAYTVVDFHLSSGGSARDL
jgi:apolipoprotein N-acyltransferase